MSNYKVTLWGTRGSIVQTAMDKMKYGLETSCISIETEKEIFLIDCGSGVRGFDRYLYENDLVHKKINILLTHYHHDHINGLGFVDFIYDKNIDIEIFGLGNVYEILKNYFGPPYFPISLVDMSHIKTTNLSGDDMLKFVELEVKTTLLEHPQMCVGYKFINGEKILTTVVDYEYKVDENKTNVEDFIRNSDYLIIDSFFTEEDYIKGWGHNSVEAVIELASKTNVRNCILTHHNVKYNDSKIDEIQEMIAKKYNYISFAKENSSFEF